MNTELKPRKLDGVHTSQLDINSWLTVLDTARFSRDFKIWKIKLLDDQSRFVSNDLLLNSSDDDGVLSLVNDRINNETYLLTHPIFDLELDVSKFDFSLSNIDDVNSRGLLGKLLLNALPALTEFSDLDLCLCRGQLFDLITKDRLSRHDRRLMFDGDNFKQPAFMLDLDSDFNLTVSKTSFKMLPKGFLRAFYQDDDFVTLSNLSQVVEAVAKQKKGTYYRNEPGFSKQGYPNNYYVIINGALKNMSLWSAINNDQKNDPLTVYQLQNVRSKFDKTNFGYGWTLDNELNVLAEQEDILSLFNRVWRSYLVKPVGYCLEESWSHLDDIGGQKFSIKKTNVLHQLFVNDQCPLKQIQVVDTLYLSDSELSDIQRELQRLSGVTVRLIKDISGLDYSLPVIILTTDYGDKNVLDTYYQSGMGWILSQHITKSNLENINVVNSVLREVKFRWMISHHYLSDLLFKPFDGLERVLISHFYASKKSYWLLVNLKGYDLRFVVVDDKFDISSLCRVDGSRLSVNELQGWVPVLAYLKSLSKDQRSSWSKNIITSFIKKNVNFELEWTLNFAEWRVLGGKFWPRMAFIWQKRLTLDQFKLVCQRCVDVLADFSWSTDFICDLDAVYNKHLYVGQFGAVLKKYAIETSTGNRYSWQRHGDQIDLLNKIVSDVVGELVYIKGQRRKDLCDDLMLPLCGITYCRLTSHDLYYLAGSGSHGIVSSSEKLPRVYHVTGDVDLVEHNLSQLANNVYVRYNAPTVNFLFVKLMNLAISIVQKRIELNK